MDGSVATIGFFDGVHRGHQFVIGCVVDEARRRGLEAVVVTFDRHPRAVLAEMNGGSAATCGKAVKTNGQTNKTNVPGCLTTRALTQQLILQAGADRCEVLHFDRQLALLSARDFMQQVLHRQLGVSVLMMGYDNRFGHRSPHSTEGFDDYVAYGREMGIEVVRLPEFQLGDDMPATAALCSSTIRKALAEGNISLANACLGRRYTIEGTVVHGYEEGRRLGFPTANLAPESVEQLLPAAGVYAVEVELPSSAASAQPLAGMMNIGTRPTFDGHALSLEVNILGYEGYLYGQRLSVRFLQRIRGEQHFQSPEALRLQLETDRQAVLRIVSTTT